MRDDGLRPRRPIRGVIFDVGNVLIQLRTMESVLASMQPPPRGDRERSPAQLDPLLRLRSDPVVDRFERGRATEGEFFDAVRRAYDPTLLDGEIRAVYEGLLGDPMPGMEELLGELRGQGVRVVGLTDISPGHLAIIERYPAVKALEAIVASCRTAYRKPEPESFHAALAVIGTEPAETLFTDDQPGNVDGARKVGLQAVVFAGAEALRKLIVDG